VTGAIQSVLERARRVRLLCVDVDGVLTDGGMYYGPEGEVLRRFNTRDGMGLARVRDAGVGVAIISGEDDGSIRARAAKLGIADVYCGIADKLAVVERLAEREGLALEEVAYVGDDLNDLGPLERVGLPCAVADAALPVRRAAAYLTRQRGGRGAVREVCELLVAARTASCADDAALFEAVLG
jgi:YrbI family 3-deoxy-D-manno-octulosonate 8-phosphate phosphatase